MPTVKQYQKGGKQEKPLDTGHYRTTTGKVVVWGTPEYREAYDRGEVVTDKGVKSPVTMKGQKLDEVVIQNNYKRGFWEKYKDKIVEENKDAGVLGAIVGTPISAVASLPQLAMMEGLTGKMQRPSEAMTIQNPYGAMAVDAVTDPANLIGAGVLTKEKVLAGLARSTEGNILSNVNKLNPFSGTGSFIKKVGNDVGLVKDLIFDKNTTLNKSFVFDSKNKIYNQIEGGYRTLDNSLEQKINELGSEEGKRRLINQEKEYLQDFYYDPKNVDLEKAATENANVRIEELENIKAFGNKNKEFAYNVDINKVNKTGINKPNIESVQYRYDIPTNNAHYEYTDDIIDNPSGSKMLPGKLTLGRGYEHSTPTAFHEINHALQRGRTLKIDNELKSIVPDFKKNLSYDDINAYTYFKSGSEGKESSSFLAELRSQMQKDGFIKNTYDNVTPELIEKTKDFYSKNKSKKVFIKDSGLQGITNTRILDFSRATPENYKIISDAMNKLPSVAPIAGASYLATQGQPQYKNGGKHTNSEQNFLKDYSTAQTFEKGGQKTDKERQAYAFFISKGWKPEQALGIVGNLVHEGGLNTTAEGDVGYKGGSSRGIAQWREGRLQKLQSMYGDKWTDFKSQLEFVDWELRNTHKTAGDKLRNSKGVWEAGKIVSDDYEIPKVKFNADERRQRNVADLAMKFKGIKLTPEDDLNYGVTFENSVAPYMNAPQIKETPLATIQIPEMQTPQVSYLDTPQETTTLAEETKSKINPQEEAFMQDLISQMAEGVAYVEPEKSNVFQEGGLKKPFKLQDERNLVQKDNTPTLQKLAPLNQIKKIALTKDNQEQLGNVGQEAIDAVQQIYRTDGTTLLGKLPFNIGAAIGVMNAVSEEKQPNLSDKIGLIPNPYAQFASYVILSAEQDKENMSESKKNNERGKSFNSLLKQKQGQDFTNKTNIESTYVKPPQPLFNEGGVIKDNNGYWNPQNWGKVVEINSPQISMKNVSQTLLGISKESGERKIMKTDNEYFFNNTKTVTEIPLTKAEENFLKDIYETRKK